MNAYYLLDLRDSLETVFIDWLDWQVDHRMLIVRFTCQSNQSMKTTSVDVVRDDNNDDEDEDDDNIGAPLPSRVQSKLVVVVRQPSSQVKLRTTTAVTSYLFFALGLTGLSDCFEGLVDISTN